MKYVNNGTAVGLTKTAQKGQDNVVAELKSKFTVRGNWFQKNTPVGIKIKAANGDNLRAEVFTNAHFLPLHDTGGTKYAYKDYIAIPTQFARPNKARKVADQLKPKALIASGKAAIVTLDSGGKAIYAVDPRRPKEGWVPMYILTKQAKIKDVDIFTVPVQKAVDKYLKNYVSDGISKALDRLASRS